MAIEIIQATVCKQQGFLIGSLDVTEVSTIGKSSGLRDELTLHYLRLTNRMGRMRSTSRLTCVYVHETRTHHAKHRNGTRHSLRQPKGERATLAFYALGTNSADVEYLAGLTVSVDDSLAIHQPESVADAVRRRVAVNIFERVVNNGLVDEQVFNLLFRHANARIFYPNLHIAVTLLTVYPYLSARGRELLCIVSQGVQHEHSERFVCLDHSLGGHYLQIDAFDGETHPTARQQIKDILQRKTFNLQAQHTLPQLYPMGQNAVIIINLLG